MDSIKLFKCLADKSRLLIINALREKPMYVELLAERLNLASSTISFHLKKLEEVGLVSSQKEQYYMVYLLNEGNLNKSLSQLIFKENSEQKLQEERVENYRQKVINSFFEYNKLKTIPVQQKKRRIILEELAKGLENNRIYQEKEINIFLADYHDDFCTLRREMVSEGILTRELGKYQLSKDFTKKD